MPVKFRTLVCSIHVLGATSISVKLVPDLCYIGGQETYAYDVELTPRLCEFPVGLFGWCKPPKMSSTPNLVYYCS